MMILLWRYIIEFMNKRKKYNSTKKYKNNQINLIIKIVIFAFIIWYGYKNFSNNEQINNTLNNTPVINETLQDNTTNENSSSETQNDNINNNLSDLQYDGEHQYIVLNDNIPYFTDSDYQSLSITEPYYEFSNLDDLGRCGQATARLSYDLMPIGEKRGPISKFKPSGWHSNTDSAVEWNRSHLIGWQFLGDATNNEYNLITGTRSFNAGENGMLPFENMIADFLKDDKEIHVLYRVTPYFENDNLVAKGVEMEAQSIEDDGDGIQFNVFIFNIEDGYEIDYATGDNWPIN